MVNGRKKVLLDYLLEKQSETWISKKQICEELKELYPRHLEKTTEHHSSVLKTISYDVRDINRDKDIPVIIVSCSKGYKVAPNEDAANKFIDKELNRALKVLKRTHIMTKKVLNDGQLDILNNIIRAFPEGEGKDELGTN